MMDGTNDLSEGISCTGGPILVDLICVRRRGVLSGLLQRLCEADGTGAD